MSQTTPVPMELVPSDAQLVSRCVDGDREAFGLVVSRYQSLVASLAYSATGCLGQSENLAQEVFITAWKHLRNLQEPAKLRSWLCGIARNVIRAHRRGRRGVSTSDGMESMERLPASGPSPADQAVSAEEEAILWRSLQRIPELYREPMVLFYREHQSVASVAEALELSEDAVKQRLARGRRLLQDKIVTLVEGALQRSAPGRAFTMGVLAALPLLATSAGAATVGAAAAKGSVVAKSAGLVSSFNAILGPLVGFLGAYLGVRASLDATRTPRERRFAVRQMKMMIGAVLVFSIAVIVYFLLVGRFWDSHPVLIGVIGVCIPAAYAGFIATMACRHRRAFRRIREEESLTHPDLFPEALHKATLKAVEYCSRWKLLGLPLIHVIWGEHVGGKVRPAIGWIAIGDRAYGVLFAVGAVAVGAISVGGVAVGVVCMGGLTLGGLAIGGLAMGGFAVGGVAVGWVATGGLAFAWVGAAGGVAFAREFALTGMGGASHLNDEAAREFFRGYWWLDTRNMPSRLLFEKVWWLPLLVLGFLALFKRQRGRKLGLTS